MQKQRLTSAYFYSLAGVAVVALTGVATGILSSRMLGPVGRGELTALLLLPGLFGTVGNLAMTQAVGYLDSPARKRSRPAAGAALAAALIAGLVISLCLVPFLSLLLPKLPKSMLGAAAICLLAIPLNYVYSVIRGEQLAQGHFRSYNLLQIWIGLGQVVFMLVFLAAGRASPGAFGMAIVLAIAAVLVAHAHTLKRMLSADGITVPWVAEVLARAWAFTQPELAKLALLRADVFILARTVSNEELGLYAVASAVAFGQAFTASPLSQVCFHSTGTAPDAATALRLLARQFRMFQFLCIGVAGFAVAVAPVLIRVAFGDRFMASTGTARILILGMTVWSCGQILDGGLRGLDLAGVGSLSNLIGLGTLFSSSVWMVRAYGIEGMAMSLLLAQSAVLLTSFWMLRAKTQCSLGQFWAFNRSGVGEVRLTATKQIRSLLRRSNEPELESVESL